MSWYVVYNDMWYIMIYHGVWYGIQCVVWYGVWHRYVMVCGMVYGIRHMVCCMVMMCGKVCHGVWYSVCCMYIMVYGMSWCMVYAIWYIVCAQV